MNNLVPSVKNLSQNNQIKFGGSATNLTTGTIDPIVTRNAASVSNLTKENGNGITVPPPRNTNGSSGNSLISLELSKANPNKTPPTSTFTKLSPGNIFKNFFK